MNRHHNQHQPIPKRQQQQEWQGLETRCVLSPRYVFFLGFLFYSANIYVGIDYYAYGHHHQITNDEGDRKRKETRREKTGLETCFDASRVLFQICSCPLLLFFTPNTRTTICMRVSLIFFVLFLI